jgi:hypothetical protein
MLFSGCTANSKQINSQNSDELSESILENSINNTGSVKDNIGISTESQKQDILKRSNAAVEVFYIKNKTPHIISFSIVHSVHFARNINDEVGWENKTKTTILGINHANKKIIAPDEQDMVFVTTRNDTISASLKVAILTDDIIVYDSDGKMILSTKNILNNKDIIFYPAPGIFENNECVKYTLEITPERIQEGREKYSLKGIKERAYFHTDSRNRSYYSYYSISDLSVFLEEKDMTILHIGSGTFSDLSPLAELRNLEELFINGNDYIVDLSPVASLNKLKRLFIGGIGIKNLKPLSELTNLEYLDLFVYGDSVEYMNLSHLINLIELDLTYSNINPISDFNFLSGMTKLEKFTVNIHDNNINFKSFRNLTNLKELIIYGADNIISLEGIENLHSLERFYLSRLYISDLSPLIKLNNLNHLELWRCTIDDFSPLKNSRLADKYLYQPDLGNIDYR